MKYAEKKRNGQQNKAYSYYAVIATKNRKKKRRNRLSNFYTVRARYSARELKIIF